MMNRKPTRVVTLYAVVVIAFSVMAGAATGVFVKDNNLGVGTDTPETPVHAKATTGPSNKIMLKLENNGAPFAVYQDNNLGISWGLQPTGGGNFSITKIGSGGAEVLVKKNGDMVLLGKIFTASCSPCVSDYVFEPDYELMPLAELAEFVASEGHLPNVPSQGDVDKAGALDLTEMQMRMLEKIEELVLYTIDQQRTIDELTERLAQLESR